MIHKSGDVGGRTRILRWFVSLVAVGAASIALLDLCGRWLQPGIPSPARALAALPASMRRLADSPCGEIRPEGLFLEAFATAEKKASEQERALQDYACLGYLHALERSWQMDHFRRIALGLSSERSGPSRFKRDVQLRLMGLDSHAARLVRELSRESLGILQAYSAGVNGALMSGKVIQGGRKLPFEPAASGWRPVDTVALLLLQAFDQTRKGFLHDMEEEELRAALGQDAVTWLTSDQMPWDVSVLKQGEYIKQERPRRRRRPIEGETHRPRNAESVIPRTPVKVANGSNNWVLAPARTASGHAWLANDPHLDLTDPPFWHPLRYQGASFSFTGFSFPGIPLIAAGSNGKVAWGLTNSYLDAADLLAVPAKMLESSEAPAPTIEWAFIPVRIGLARIPVGPIPLRRFGATLPVLPIEVSGLPPKDLLLLRWSGFHLQGADLDPLFSLLTAKSALEGAKRLAKVGVPSWNYVLADASGDIAYRAVGLIPRRRQAPANGLQRLGPELKELAHWDWKREDFLTPDEMPHVENPSRGWVVTANERQWPSDAAFHGGRAYSQGFRGFRIEELLASNTRHTLESQRSIQCDVQAVDARFLLPLLLDITLGEERKPVSPATWNRFRPRTRRALEALLSWDYEVTPGCRACGLYRLWISRIQTNLGGVEEPYLFRLFTGVLEEISVDSDIADRRPAARSVISASLEEALDELLGATEGEFPSWGDLHFARFAHLGGSERELSIQKIATPGDDHTVNPGSSDWDGSALSHRSGASMRMLIELSQPVRIWAVLAGPRTGGQPYEERMQAWERWRDCRLERVQ